MRTFAAVILVFAGSAGFAAAEERRSADAHVHGVSQLDIAVEGEAIEMALTAPAADILGFEYEARTDEEKKATAAAIATLKKPLTLFTPNEEAGCKVVQASAEKASHDDHDDHGHKEHGHKDHGHKDHGHDHHGHHDHGHDDHAKKHAGDKDVHSDLSGAYKLTCANTGALKSIAFPYFKAFPNAEKVNVRLITGKGQFAYTVERGAPTLDISDAI